MIPLKEPEAAARVMAPKVQGTLALQEALAGEPLDFFVLCSSVAALLGGFGQVDYCGANAFLDAYARWAGAPSSGRLVSVNWDAWREVGMAVNTPVTGVLQTGPRRSSSRSASRRPRASTPSRGSSAPGCRRWPSSRWTCGRGSRSRS